LQAKGTSSAYRQLVFRDLGLAGGLGVVALLFIFLAFSISIWILVLGLPLLAGAFWFVNRAGVTLQKWRSQERLATLLHEVLGENYIYFLNLLLSENRSIGMIDGVLLGPYGALVLEVAPFSGQYICEGDTWYKYMGEQGSDIKEQPILNRKRLKDSPTWKVIRAAREVKSWLSVRNLPQVPVQPVVVLDRGKLFSSKHPNCPIVEHADLENYLKEHLFHKGSSSEASIVSEGMLEQIAQRLKNA
jgi:hypothetical protein